MQILLIGPTFFGYRDRVHDELVKEGHQVECVNDRPSETTFFKSLAKISYRLAARSITRYAEELAKRVATGNYDLVLYMGGMSFCFTHKQFSLIRNSSNARFVAYLWDAFVNCKRFGQCCDLFHDVYSFEVDDCKRYGLRLRPLFFSDTYGSIPLKPKDGFAYDACFIGSVHQPGKFKIVSEIAQAMESQGYRVFKYFYMPSKTAEIRCKILHTWYRGLTFQYEPLSAGQVAEIYSQSRAIIDSPQSGQSGLTMRTLETLGARRKLITSNEDVMHYDFAKYGDVLVWRGAYGRLDDFMHSPYRCPPESVFDNYSISTFVKTLLGEEPPYGGYHYDDCSNGTEGIS